MKTKDLLTRIDHLIDQCNTVVSSQYKIDYYVFVNAGLFHGFRSATLSFIGNLLGTDHTYYSEFNRSVKSTDLTDSSCGLNILKAIRHEIENGWLTTIRELVTAEVFSNFLEMSEHLLEEGYKDAAAVMIGSVLEEHLRNLCSAHNVETHFMNKGDSVPKKADVINADLRKADVYNALKQKQVTAWLGLRNDAAHGHYGNYTKGEVKLMYQGVLNFLTETK